MGVPGGEGWGKGEPTDRQVVDLEFIVMNDKDHGNNSKNL